MYLQHLSVSGFRGVGAQLDLPLTYRTIFYGPNGSGKSSVLQAIAWTLYGKLPMFSGGVFTREDALVNDFLDDGKAEVLLTLSGGKTIQRRRSKRTSTGVGVTSPLLSFSADDPQAAVEQLLGLNSEEFFAAVFLHQETIRDFLTTTPEKRSATIDRMIGTYFLRTLIKLVDPGIPDKAIGEAQNALKRIDLQLSQASVLNREMIQKKKEQYGDPETLPQGLASALQQLTPILMALGLLVPEATLAGLSSSLSAARQVQLERVSALTRQVGEFRALKQRYEHAAETNWQPVRAQKAQFGDPYELPELLEAVHGLLTPICQKLVLAPLGDSLTDLENGLSAARRAQPAAVARLEQEIAALKSLKDRYHQAAVTNWQELSERKSRLGEAQDLPTLLAQALQRLTPILQSLELTIPLPALPALEASLVEARRVLPGMVSKLERQAGELLAQKERYLLASQEVIEALTVPAKLTARRDELKAQIEVINREITTLMQDLNELRAKEQQTQELRFQIQALPELGGEVERLQGELKRLEIAGKQGKLYNQVLDVGRQYLEQVRPEHCPVCKQTISDLNHLLDTLRSETPADVEKMRQEFNEFRQQLALKQSQVSDLESKQKHLARLEGELAKFPAGLGQQIAQRRQEGDQAAGELAKIQAEISQIEGRIRLATENRQRLQDLTKEIETRLGRAAGPDPVNALEQMASETRQKAAEWGAFDFQPIANWLARARQLYEIEQDETRLRWQLQKVLVEVKKVLGPLADEEISNAFEKAVQKLCAQASEVQALDFQPIADELTRARQLQQIRNEETRLRKELEAVRAEVRQRLNLPAEEADLRSVLDHAIQDAQDRISQINAIDLQPVEAELQRAVRLDEIRGDEARLRKLESNYQIANRERARLDYQIRRLTELREALLDISETTKRHQESIVIGVLNNLDIHRYYQRLDPHPAYTDLQIEPELTSKGTYNYWIKALTGDYSRGTYVQTRFSTAQANCAAIAIFLAINQHLSKNLETIILDDPSQSMDPDHQQRLAQTLASSPRQVIVATEDPQMYEFLQGAFNEPTIHKLSPWTTDGSKLI
jgi:exonuclease SbcC